MGFLSFTLIIFIYILIIYGSNRISTTKKNEVETKTCSYFLPSRESAIRPLCASAYPRRAPLQLVQLICAPKSAGLNANPLPSPTRPPPPPSIDRPRPLAASSASVRPRYRRLASLARLPHQRRNPSTVLHPHHTVSRNRRQGRRRSGTQLPPLVGRVADLGRARAPPLPRLPSHPSSTVDPSSVSPQSFAVPPSSAPSPQRRSRLHHLLRRSVVRGASVVCATGDRIRLRPSRWSSPARIPLPHIASDRISAPPLTIARRPRMSSVAESTQLGEDAGDPAAWGPCRQNW
jgi:hypothetical protein